MLKGRSVAELEADYRAALARLKELPKDLAARLRGYEAFVRKQSHHLARHPGELLALAHAQPLDSPVLADARQRFDDGPDRPWLRLLYPPATDPNRALLRTIDVGFWVYTVACLEIDQVWYVHSGSEDGVLRLWSLATGERVREYRGHRGAVNGMVVTAAGQVVSASADKTLRVWDLHSGVCRHTLAGHTHEVSGVAVTADGQAVSASRDQTLRVWDLRSGACSHTLAGHTSYVNGVAVTADGQAVSVSYDQTLRVWDLHSGACLSVFRWDYPLWSVAVTALPPYIVVAGDSAGNVLFFRLENLDRV